MTDATVPRVVLPALLVLCQACALTDTTIRVDHPAAVTQARLSSPHTVGLGTRMQAVTVGVVREGVKKNGYATDTASVFTDPKPTELVRAAMAVELQQAGFVIDNSVGSPRILVEIHQLFAEPEVGIWTGDVYAVLDATVTVVVDSTHAYKRRVKGIGSVTTMMWVDSFYKESFELALTDFLRKAVPGIVDLFQTPAPLPPAVLRLSPEQLQTAEEES